MRFLSVVVLCIATMLAKPVHAQNFILEPIHVPAGTVLNFHLQTRLNPGSGNDVDILPGGTVLRVKILDTCSLKFAD